LAKIERKFIPHISDLTQGVIYQGNEGSKWIVQGSITGEDRINVELTKLPVEELIIKEENNE
jgi:hypothetical protein